MSRTGRLFDGDIDAFDIPADDAADRSPAPAIPFTWSEAYRHVCEVHYVQGLEPDAREAYLQGVAKKRGQAAAQRLRRDALT